MLALSTGGQSWLVGNGSPRSLDCGVHAMPLLAPPWQTPLLGTSGEPPVQSGHGWMPGSSGRLSPVRKISALSGRLMFSSPVAQSAVPLRSLATTFTTHVLVGVLLAFGIGSGAPNRHPA